MRALLLTTLLLTACADTPAPAYDPTAVGQQLPDVVAALQAGEPDGALARLDALAAAGRLPTGHEHFRAVALLDAGRPAEALPVLQAELAARPGNGAAQLMLAEALLALGRVAEAGPPLAQARRLLPDTPYRLLVEGRVAQAGDDDVAARAAFEAYLKQDNRSPRAAEAHHALGQITRRAGEESLAAAHAERSAYLEQANQFLNSYRQRLEDDPQDAEAALGAGMVFLGLMETLGPERELAVQAEAAFRRNVALDPGSVRGHYNLAFLAKLAGLNDQAMSLYERTVELDPEHVGARLNLGTLALQLGRLDEAETQLLAGLERAQSSSDRVRARFQLGQLAETREQPAEAAVQYRLALEIDADDPRLAGLAEYLQTLDAGSGG